MGTPLDGVPATQTITCARLSWGAEHRGALGLQYSLLSYPRGQHMSARHALDACRYATRSWRSTRVALYSKRPSMSPSVIAFISLPTSVLMVASSTSKLCICIMRFMRSPSPPYPAAVRGSLRISCTAGMSFIMRSMPTDSGGPSLHSSTMLSSRALFAGCANVVSAVVSSARAVAAVSAGGPAGAAAAVAAFFLSARVRFHSALSREPRHVESSQLSRSARVG
mmetsp:Transcript_19110/g.48943  ORF Transcript_19110/g.48943 Transcript_19110/m.48943 type:complete len:224 (+) Transcript_19110:248-919(+)